MASQQVEVYRYSQISSSANINAAAGVDSLSGEPHRSYLGGIFVSAASNTPTITVYDDTGTGTTTKVVDTFTPVAGTWYRLPFVFGNGIYIAIGGTVSCTAAWQTP
jgi:hypothetical protein